MLRINHLEGLRFAVERDDKMRDDIATQEKRCTRRGDHANRAERVTQDFQINAVSCAFRFLFIVAVHQHRFIGRQFQIYRDGFGNDRYISARVQLALKCSMRIGAPRWTNGYVDNSPGWMEQASIVFHRRLNCGELT